MRIPVALFNHEAGGSLPTGGYDFGSLQRTFSSVDEIPALILYCEGKRFLAHGRQGLYWCAEALSDQLGAPYIPLPGTMRSGPIGPVVFYRAGRSFQRKSNANQLI